MGRFSRKSALPCGWHEGRKGPARNFKEGLFIMTRTTLALAALLLAPLFPACAVQHEGGNTDESADTSDAENALSRPGKFETFQGKDGQFYFHLLAGNGEKVLGSEGYTTQAAAEGGIASVKANGTTASRFELRVASSGEWYFVLKAGNGAVIGVSETYVTQSNAQRAVDAVIKVVGTTTSTEPARDGARFEVFKGIDGHYYFDLRAGNGEIVLQSQGYTSKSAANDGVTSVRNNAAVGARYELRDAVDGSAYFVLKAANGQIIGRSEMYASHSNAARGETDVQALFAH